MNSSVFSDFLNSARDVEERTASGKLFQTEVAAAEKHLPPMVARQVREIWSMVMTHTDANKNHGQRSVASKEKVDTV